MICNDCNEVIKFIRTFNFFFKRSSVVNANKKICKDCKYFIGDTYECGKFGETDLITGKVTYWRARELRDDKTKCGENAVDFEENNLHLCTFKTPKNDLWSFRVDATSSHFTHFRGQKKYAKM